MNPLLASFFALASSVLFAVFSVMARRNMRHASAFTGSLITLSMGTAVLVVVSAFYSSWGELTLPVALWFLAGGALAPGLAQALMFLSIGYIGVGRAMPLITVTPFFSTLVAMAWLGERPGAVVLGATLFVVAGCVLLALKREGERPWRRIFILMPMAHAVSFAFAASIRKHVLALMPEPLLGATLSYAISIPVLFFFYPFLPADERFTFNRAGVKGFAARGLDSHAFFFLPFHVVSLRRRVDHRPHRVHGAAVLPTARAYMAQGGGGDHLAENGGRRLVVHRDGGDHLAGRVRWWEFVGTGRNLSLQNRGLRHFGMMNKATSAL